MRFALVAALLLLAPVLRAGIEPGDLELELLVDETLRPGSLDDPLSVTLTLRLINRKDEPVGGHILAALPEPVRIVYWLKAKERTDHPVEVTLPAGRASERDLAFTVEAAGETVLGMEVKLAKVGGWKIFGPYGDGKEAVFDRVFLPEEGREMDWQPLDPGVRDASGYHDLNAALGFHENAAAYIKTGVWAEERTDAVLSLGSDDGVKVWLNGALVHANKIHRGSAPGQDRVPVTLKPGRNEFLLKVCNDDGGWGFHFDLEDGQGNPKPGVRYEVGPAVIRPRDARLRVLSVTRSSARFTWKSDRPSASRVTITEAEPGRTLVREGVPKEKMNAPRKGAVPRIVEQGFPCTTHTLEVHGLRPGTRYLAVTEPGVGGKPSRAAAFYTLPPEGMTQYLVLRLACVIFKATTPLEDRERNGAALPCPAERVEQLKRDMEQTVLFYWVASGMRLVLHVEYFETDEYHAGAHALYGVGYGGEDEEAYRKILKKAGRRAEEFDGRLFVAMEKRWDEGRKQWYYPASGGGTIGPEAWPGYGKSAWKGGADNAWLFCHEFQHQLDALYHYSHGPEHLFCHFQPWDDTAHRHGEHWDGIAWLLLEWAGHVTRAHQGRPYLPPSLGHRYFLCRWGRVALTADRDNDGFPDRDPRVPLDEARFASDPSRADTDRDGLSDLMEALACHWVEWGHGECWAGEPSRHRADPRNPDTDGDGLIDGNDPYPLYPVDPRIPKGEPGRPFAEFRDPAFNGDFTLGWDDDFLYIGCTSKPERLKIYLDLNDDGWFMGADNYDLRVKTGPEGASLNPRFHNCGVPGKWPFYEDGRLEAGRDVHLEESEWLVLKVARAPAMGLDLVAGERIGILVALLPVGGTGRPPSRGDLTLFEPHTFFTFTLENR
jgi:hypothetical protein